MRSPAILLIILLVAAAAVTGYFFGRSSVMPPAIPRETSGRSVPPPVTGFSRGQEILFIHTEASDKQVADLLTMMMGSPVLFVPALGMVPLSALGEVYVFTNGVPGGGPMGFQPDIFSSVPGDSDYTPLRALRLVTWRSNAVARELRSVEEVKTAELAGEFTITRPDVIINMPVVEWPGGKR